ncbi:MAG: hypothetical protein HWN80_01725 [Candidatus Lokiarchaeota archaeon]|nr:hypothetical protein [Candidatus Lokiarchaeota archaeon]
MRKIRFPEAFQGNLKKKYYYEGWYNKIVDINRNFVYTFIPTIAINKKANSSHAFVQILDGKTGHTDYIIYELDQFENLANNDFHIRIGNNVFSSRGFELNIIQNKTKIKGLIEYTTPVLWPKTFLQPGIMGIMSFFPFLETYHDIVSMNHGLKGKIDFNGRILDFNGGKGYLEKDWGTSFPKAYIWAQTNHFSNPQLSFILSIALVPLFKIRVKGFFCVIWYQGNFYKFATYSGAKIKLLDINSDELKIKIEDRKLSLQIIINKKNIRFSKLKAPVSGMMSSNIIETINSNIKIILYNKRNNKTILEDIGMNAGLDLSNIELLV